MTDPSPRRILIVEDEFLLALQLEDILLDGGYEVAGLVSDQASLAGLAQKGEYPDLALVDLNLRDGLTGPTIAREICDRFGARVIYVTANPGQIGDPPASRAVGVVQKPFDRARILSAVRYALEGSPTATPPPGLERLGA